MSNIIYPKLTFPRVVSRTFEPLYNLILPARDPNNSGKTGRFIDANVKKLVSADPSFRGPDLTQFGIEVKSKYDDTSTDWTIGSMTLFDILNTKEYKNTEIYKKMQCLLLCTCNDDLRRITEFGLYYMDTDKIQILMEDSYVEARDKILNFVLPFWSKNEPINWTSNFQKFKGCYGKFERTSGANSLSFRITVSDMENLKNISSKVKSLSNFTETT